MPRGRPQGEALAVWALLAVDLAAVLVTYSVVDPVELYNVSREGLEGGLSRALVQLNFPIALAALPVALLALDALPRRAWLVGGPALALCAVTAIPGVVDQADLDARPVNALPALGVALALGLTIGAARMAGTTLAPWRTGDRWRVAAAAVAVVLSLPWITAELGFHLPGGVFLTDEPYREPGEGVLAAVHLGHHHGFAGTLIFLVTLMLSRTWPIGPRTQAAYAALVSLGLAYGATNLVQDLWHEQLVKRDWISWSIPSATEPEPSAMWALILAGTALAYALGFGRSRVATTSRDNPAT